MIRLRMLGSLGIERQDGTSAASVLTQPKRFAVLAFLAADPSTCRPRDTLLALFWPESDEEHARASLRQTLYLLRKSLGPGVLTGEREELIGVAPEGLWSDVAAFERELEEGRPEAALTLYKGPFLEGFHLSDVPEFERWMEDSRRQLQLKALDAACSLAESSEMAGDGQAARGWSEMALQLSPYDERILRRYLRLLTRQGDRATAVRVYERFTRRLSEDLALEPSSETVASILDVRDSDSARKKDPPVRATAVSPTARRTQGADESASADKGRSPDDERDGSRGPGRPGRTWFARASAVLAATVAVAGAWHFGGIRPDTSRRGAIASEPLPLLLSDFRSAPADRSLATTVQELFRIDLGSSPAVRLVDPVRIARTLDRMELGPATRLDRRVAREIALRNGAGVYISGQLHRAGPAFVVTAELADAESGIRLWSDREVAGDSSEIIRATERLSRRLRGHVGESPASLRRSRALPDVTTSSLAALQSFAHARRLNLAGGATSRSLALLEEAVEADSTFAMAHAYVGMLLWNAGTDIQRRDEAFTRAYELRDRLTRSERLYVMGLYHAIVEGDWDRAATEWRTLVALVPDHALAWRALAVSHMRRGDVSRAYEATAKAAEADPRFRRFVVSALIDLGRFEEADAALDTLEERRVDAGWLPVHRARLQWNRGDWDGAERYLRSSLARREDPPTLGDSHAELADLFRARGRLREARAAYREALRHYERAERPSRHLKAAAGLADVRRLLGTRTEALKTLAEALELFPLESGDASSRSYAPLAYAYARAGEPARARPLLLMSAGETSAEARLGGFDWFLDAYWAADMTALAEGRARDVVGRLREDAAAHDRCLPCRSLALAVAFDSAGVPDSAITHYEAYLVEPSFHRLSVDAYHLAEVLERVATLHDLLEHPDEAAEHYAAFAGLWDSTDPELQPRVEAARRRLAVLRRQALPH